MSEEGESLGIFAPESEAALEKLKRAFRRGTGFALYVVVAQDAARWEALRMLRAWSGVGGVPELYFFPEGSKVVGALEGFIAKNDTEHPLTGAVIGDSRPLFEVDGGEPIAALNLARDNLGFLIRGPLVLLVSREHAGKLPSAAPDLFDVRAMSVELEAEVVQGRAGEILSRPYQRGEAARPVAELRREAAQLRALEAGPEAPAPGALSDAWNKLSRWFFEAGEMAEALEAVQKAKVLAERIGYDGGVAAANLAIGDVYMQLGRWEAGLAAYQQARGMFERLGDMSSHAVVGGGIGTILQRRGQLDEALRLWREEVLPAFERLGDMQGKAIAMANITEILRRKGQFDEALRILQQQVLPAFERLGDTHGLIGCRTQLAKILLQRGRPEDRPEIAGLLAQALADAERLGLPQAETIRTLQAQLAANPPGA